MFESSMWVSTCAKQPHARDSSGIRRKDHRARRRSHRGGGAAGVLRMRAAVHVAFEEGTQAQWLHDLLASGWRAWSSATAAADVLYL